MSVEWWAHARQGGEAHQLHFDMDEGRLHGVAHGGGGGSGEGGGGLNGLHPLVSCVVYLRCGGPRQGKTLVTNQVLECDSVATAGWLVSPAVNRLLAFDGRYLHGVIPNFTLDVHGDDDNDNNDDDDDNGDDDGGGYRVTLMLGIWHRYEYEREHMTMTMTMHMHTHTYTDTFTPDTPLPTRDPSWPITYQGRDSERGAQQSN